MARVQEIYPCGQHFHLRLMVFRWNQLYTNPMHHTFDNLRMTLNSWRLENSKQFLNTIGIKPVVYRPETSVFDYLRMRLINQERAKDTFKGITLWFGNALALRCRTQIRKITRSIIKNYLIIASICKISLLLVPIKCKAYSYLPIAHFFSTLPAW